MYQNALKKQAALAALDFIKPGDIVGVGTGSTVNYFIDALATKKHQINGAVISSQATRQRLQALGIEAVELNQVSKLPLYIDGADEINTHLQMIKGGGAALTGEKIVAACAKQFICIADQNKYVEKLGSFPLPIEVIPMARSYVARELVKLGGTPVYRQGCVTDYGNVILDVYNLPLLDPEKWEETLNHITGVVTNGLFAKRRADVLLLGTPEGVKKVTRAQTF